MSALRHCYRRKIQPDNPSICRTFTIRAQLSGSTYLEARAQPWRAIIPVCSSQLLPFFPFVNITQWHSIQLFFPSFGSIGTAITDICIVRVFSTLLLQYEMTFMHLHFVPHRRKEVRHTSTRRHHPPLSRGAPVVLTLIILIERIAYRHRNKNK